MAEDVNEAKPVDSTEPAQVGSLNKQRATARIIFIAPRRAMFGRCGSDLLTHKVVLHQFEVAEVGVTIIIRVRRAKTDCRTCTAR